MLLERGSNCRGSAHQKDIATFSGVRDNQLIGYGLAVVGLSGTGDKSDSAFTLRLDEKHA